MQGNPHAHLTVTEWKSIKGQVIRKEENQVSPLYAHASLDNSSTKNLSHSVSESVNIL